MTTITKTSTPRQFRAWAEAAFRAANPDVVALGCVIEWVRSWKGKFPTGYCGFTGSFTVTAPGYRTCTMSASWVEGEGGMIR